MNRVKRHVKTGDRVEVTTGAHKGAQGVVMEVQAKKSRLLIEGVCMIKKTV
ncbi:MAG: KOW motif-containing protein, partial [Roseimicrobium sp.]